jgi:hypothetical protein
MPGLAPINGFGTHSPAMGWIGLIQNSLRVLNNFVHSSNSAGRFLSLETLVATGLSASAVANIKFTSEQNCSLEVGHPEGPSQR